MKQLNENEFDESENRFIPLFFDITIYDKTNLQYVEDGASKEEDDIVTTAENIK